MKKKYLGSGETRLESIISYLLITGVIISLLLEITGIVLFYATFHTMQISHDPTVYINGNNFFVFLADQISGTHAGTLPLRLMTLGIIVLILTPYIRAIASVIYFAWVKNVKYVFITLFVLTLLTASLIWRFAKL
jgi:uncharacterized membrane protein